MAIRIIGSSRGIHDPTPYHHCPKKKENIFLKDCNGCKFFKGAEELKVTYRVHCNKPTKPKLWQIEPARASDSVGQYKGDAVVNAPEHTLLEPKLDGARAIVHCLNGKVYITSRSRNKEGLFNRFEANVPHLQNHKGLRKLGKKGYTVLDAEICVDVEKDKLPTLMTIVGSSPEIAIKKQKEMKIQPYLAVFDVIAWEGMSLVEVSQKLRRSYIDNLLPMDQYIRKVPQFYIRQPRFKLEMVKYLMEQGFEGMILKHHSASYGESKGWLKFKQRMTIDLQLTSWSPGKVGSRFEHTIGTLNLSAIDEETGELREMAKVIPGDDKMRAGWYKILKNLTEDEITDQQVILEVECQEITKYNRMRHPRILRYRRDRSEPNIWRFK